MDTQAVALITGANKSIGFEIARQLGRRGIRVLIGSRDAANGERAVDALQTEGIAARMVLLDVTNAATITEAAAKIEAEYGRLDILVNNAGITGGSTAPPSGTDLQTMRDVYDTNLFGPVAVTNAMLPLLRLSAAGRIVNMSSGLGSLSQTSDPGWEYYMINALAYQSSKTALNAVTVLYAKELKDTPVKVNAADPGYCATDMNQHSGPRTVEQGAVIAVRLALLDANGPTGTFQDENGIVPW